MADLIAQGSDAAQRWRRPLPTGEAVLLGRNASWSVPWDDRISRRHAELLWDGEKLTVRKLPDARNPLFVNGAERDEFVLIPGNHFVIGGTTFTLAADRAFVTVAVPQPSQQQAFSAQYLRRMRFRHADQRIEILSRLPEVMSAAASEFDQHVRIVNLLLAGVPRADSAALVQVAGESQPVDLRHWDRRIIATDNFEPSDRLIREAVRRAESVVHVWKGSDSALTPTAFTAQQGVDWAYCTPVPGKASEGLAIYVAGRFAVEPASGTSDPTDLRDDLKFTELAAATLGSLREVRKLEHERASLSQFFSPVVLETLAAEDPEVALQPREAEVTVIFCDLRGFSRASERQAADLMGLLERVSTALGLTTRHICDEGGVLGDFHGDAVMGFWGWPIGHDDAPLRAARAALAIRDEFDSVSQTDDALANFRVGIGIGTGRAVAGKIGTVNQVKVTAFGPVVNLASRLEGMTKTLHAPILIDERTAGLLKLMLPADIGRLRRVARVRPYGLDRPLEVSELLPPEETFPVLSSAQINEYEQALDDLYLGRWHSAFERLHRVPAEDRVKDFLTMFIVQHNRTAPEGWNGVIPLASK